VVLRTHFGRGRGASRGRATATSRGAGTLVDKILTRSSVGSHLWMIGGGNDDGMFRRVR
jgi:hypothetical protein